MGRKIRRLCMGAGLIGIGWLSPSAPCLADDGQADQYALLLPRLRSSQESSEVTNSGPATTAPTTSAAGAMTLLTPAPQMPAESPGPEETYEPATAIPLSSPGFTGPSPLQAGPQNGDFLPIPDRWRIGFPSGYPHDNGVIGHWYDPYNQNVLKGDYPFWGNDKFIVLTATSDTLLETRKLPNPSGVSSLNPNSIDFFGDGKQYFINQNLILSASIFQGDAGYKPKDWEIRITPVFNLNYLQVSELGISDVDVRQGRYREDQYIGFQEAFAEVRLPYQSPNFDFTSVRVGIQGFNSDFRGFLFDDNEPGVRIFGDLDNNRIQWNLAWFHTIEKNTNSGLNSYTLRDQDIFFANVFFQDVLKYFNNHSTNPLLQGFTIELTAAANLDNSGEHVKLDDNGFIVRPQPIGTIHDKAVRAYYLGIGGDGHIGRINIDTQFYQAFGNESFDALANRGTQINAQLFTLELSYDVDWMRYRASFLYASGDNDPTDGQARGFDSIFDNPNFAGGGFSFFTRQAIPLTGAGVNLVNRNSFLPDLRTSKEQGQANFVNPGLFIYNIGWDADLTPKIKLITNVSYLQFVTTKSLQTVLFDDKIGRDIGIDYSLGIQYRPYLNNNIILILGAAALQPLNGYKDIYQGATEYSIFTSATVTF